MAEETTLSKKPTWLITGSSSGFGLQLTRLALSKGHNVIATSRNPSRTPDLVSEVIGLGGRWEQLDLQDLESGKLIGRLEAEGVHVDILINTAGMGIAGALESFSEEEARRQMDVNFFGPFRLVRAVAPYMRRRRSGTIVNFSSGAGLEAMNSLGVYGASKAALDDMTKVLHKELEPFGVRVLLVYLGTFNTSMASSVQAVAAPMDPDYAGTQTERLFNMLSKGDFALPGDHVKACQAIYNVIMDEGSGKGLGNEIMMVLGRDAANTVKRSQDRLVHMMDVFGDICHNVNTDEDIKTPW